MKTVDVVILFLGLALAAGAPAAAGEITIHPAAPIPAGFHDFPGMVAVLDDLAHRHENIARLVDICAAFSAPASHEGRSLFALKISDHPALDEDEPAVLVTAGIHGREAAPPEIALALCAEILNGYGRDENVTRWVDTHEIWIAPVCNPDGLAHVHAADPFWRKNRSPRGRGDGVDLNRNFPFGWDGPHCGKTLEYSETYRGPAPASEPETQALLALARDRRFAKLLDIHSAGREVIYTYFSPRSFPPALESWHADKAAELAFAIGYEGRTGKPSAEGELYQWALCDLGAFAFLIETALELCPPREAVQEEARMVFAGLAWLLDHEIPVSGHVTAAGTGAPIEAAIAVRGIRYLRGETRLSSPTTGRFHYFLPPGRYVAEVAAPGYAQRTVAFVVDPGAPAVVNVELAGDEGIAAAARPAPSAGASFADLGSFLGFSTFAPEEWRLPGVPGPVMIAADE